MMANGDTGTVLITGPASGLGRALTLELAGRAESDRPDLLLVGRPGERLTEITSLVRGRCDRGSNPLRPFAPGRRS